MSQKIELWSLRGPHWRLPLRVVWFDSLAEVRVGGGARLTRKMIAAAEDILKSVGTLKGSWWVTRVNLERVAQPFPGDDPDDVVEWTPVRVKEPVKGDFDPPDKFILEYCKSQYAWVRDPLVADAIYVSFCKFMMHWLLNEKRTVPLMFANLDAFCLRKNWATAAAKFEYERAKVGRILPSHFLNPDPQNMLDRGVGDYLVSAQVTAFDAKYRVMMYTLECTTTPEWDRIVRKIEKAKIVIKKGFYMQNVSVILRRQLTRVLYVYSNFLKEVARPLADVHTRDMDRNYNRQKKGGSRVARVASGPWTRSIVMSVPVESRLKKTMDGKDAPVPEVPDLQPGDEDVRDTGPESVPGSDNG